VRFATAWGSRALQACLAKEDIRMAQSGTKSSPSRINGPIIINELIRNMELGRLELGYSILLPCIFSVYLHPDDYERLKGVHDIIREDARRALNSLMAQWNANKGGLLRRSPKPKTCRIAQSDWAIDFFADGEASVPPGDVEIHSALNDISPPGYRGAKTTLLDRAPSVTSARVARDRQSTRRQADTVFAEIRYQDDSGPQTFYVTQNEVSIGRGGEDLWVDLALFTTEEISREHVRLRRDASTGAFAIIDKSRNGTWLNGRRLRRDQEVRLPERAEIGLADVLKLSFEARHA
jgi:FHA domain-containing protein